ncbi:membrane protein [Streptomyces sp. AS58]|uniref:DMT family transporter n=1 Tax=Streptomyces sp. AS58 TaxID=1519489 RepID=UPI0006AF393E|nr:EamA family transporter [Streptomyces sp. AS58]KOV51939.1 membrane protein [Streptomyces sp. AS58]
MRPAHLALAVLVAAVWGVNFTVIEIGLDRFPPLLFSALFAAAALGERPSRLGVTGMAVALAGIAVAAVDEGTTGPLTAFALVVAAAACWGASNVLTRRAAPPDALNFMVWVSAVPVLPLLLLSLWTEGPARDLEALRALDRQGAGTILYVAWITTVFGFGAWGLLLRRHPASTVAPFSLLVPVFGMTSAALFLGEPVTPLRWCAAVLLVGGVAVTSLAPRRGAPARRVDPDPAAADRAEVTPSR